MTTPSKETLLKNAETIVKQGFKSNGYVNCTAVDCMECISNTNESDGSCKDMNQFIEYINKHKGEQEKMIENHDIVKIDPKQCKKMLVWGNDENETIETYVYAKIGDNYLAVHFSDVDRFLSGESFVTNTTPNVKPIPEAKEITIADIEEKFGCKVKIVEGGE